MRTIVLSKENMDQVRDLLQPIIEGEASFAEDDFFDFMNPYVGEWKRERTRIITQVQHHWMFELWQETGIHHHADRLGNESLFRLHCHATSADILHAGDILYVISDEIVVIEKKYELANSRGRFLKISLVRKFEDLTRREITDAAYLEKEMSDRQDVDAKWFAEQEEKEDQEEMEERFDLLLEDQLWDI